MINMVCPNFNLVKTGIKYLPIIEVNKKEINIVIKNSIFNKIYPIILFNFEMLFSQHFLYLQSRMAEETVMILYNHQEHLAYPKLYQMT